jgi:transcriptional regulator with XRE-family HTH domain
MTASAAVSARVKALRAEAGVSQTQLAEAARRYGLNWHDKTVSYLESGRRKLTADELLLLPSVLTFAFGRVVGLHHLLDAEQVQLASDDGPTVGNLRILLYGVVSATGGPYPAPEPEPAAPEAPEPAPERNLSPAVQPAMHRAYTPPPLPGEVE